MTLRVSVNGEHREVAEGSTVAQVVATVTGTGDGVAAAFNGEVLPRRSWPGTLLREGDQVEIVTAVPGG
jgi:sulfur carrier protein